MRFSTNPFRFEALVTNELWSVSSNQNSSFFLWQIQWISLLCYSVLQPHTHFGSLKCSYDAFHFSDFHFYFDILKSCLPNGAKLNHWNGTHLTMTPQQQHHRKKGNQMKNKIHNNNTGRFRMECYCTVCIKLILGDCALSRNNAILCEIVGTAARIGLFIK